MQNRSPNALNVKQLHVSATYSHHQTEHKTINKKKTTIQRNKIVGTRSRLTQFYSYSDCLRAGRAGDRIPVGARFSAPVQTGPEAHPASCTMGTGSFRG